ncbi:hypothetical protein ACFRMQ_14555 [Kitasatospora sp. NPDC056783]|uniref:hypothetical protein n=1 Tax=Kitasatospora sp. NPDC056783 TaxID=3345943 RepID=UPI0036CCD9E2
MTPDQSQQTPSGDTGATETSAQDREIARLRGHVASLEGQLSALRAENAALREWVAGDPVAAEFVRLRSDTTTTLPGSPE